MGRGWGRDGGRGDGGQANVSRVFGLHKLFLGGKICLKIHRYLAMEVERKMRLVFPGKTNARKLKHHFSFLRYLESKYSSGFGRQKNP